MNHLGILQDRIAKRLGVNQVFIHDHLAVLGSTLVKDSMLVADFIKTFTRSFIVDEKVKP
jgi:hypothetical protein